jgi:putative hydrolase of the HAD superfamily
MGTAMIQAILFDFGNTLVSTELDWEVIIDQNIDSLLTYLDSVGIKVDKETFGKSFLSVRDQNFKKAERELREYTAEESLSQMLAQFGIINVAPEILEQGVNAFFAPELNLYPVFPDVPEVLTELKSRGYKLAIVSNATSGRLIRKAAAGRDLTQYFETIIVSADIGYRKPHPKIFQLALDFLKVKPEQTVMVGDLLDYDIIGAQKLGMKTILAKFVQQEPNLDSSTALRVKNFNNQHPDSTNPDGFSEREPGTGIIPDAVATSFRDIIKYIEQFDK